MGLINLNFELYTRFQDMQSRYGIQQQGIWSTEEYGIVLSACMNFTEIGSFLKK